MTNERRHPARMAAFFLADRSQALRDDLRTASGGTAALGILEVPEPATMSLLAEGPDAPLPFRSSQTPDGQNAESPRRSYVAAHSCRGRRLTAAMLSTAARMPRPKVHW